MRTIRYGILALMLSLPLAGCDDSTEVVDSGAEGMDAGGAVDSGPADSGAAEDAGHDAGECVPAGGDCAELPCCDDLPCSASGAGGEVFHHCG